MFFISLFIRIQNQKIVKLLSQSVNGVMMNDLHSCDYQYSIDIELLKMPMDAYN
jgi:hypothetical protein